VDFSETPCPSSTLTENNLNGSGSAEICYHENLSLNSAGYRFDKTQLKLKLNSVALVRERTIPTELVGEVSANFCG
jgi:hypothetical protein